ncbi:MAG TPA: ribosome assembly RNA-binding protein YhbY [Polyangiaceae bacterium]|nr:ribosome assembly RNA-binding protein YhbY [Polyangiaceae bacterium]
MTATGRRPLTGKQRRYLRALAHDQKPVVQVGKTGLRPSVVEAVEKSLVTHELIKVKVASDSEQTPEEVAHALEEQTGAHLAQIIGRVLVLYRRRADDPKIVLPRAEKRPADDDEDD